VDVQADFELLRIGAQSLLSLTPSADLSEGLSINLGVRESRDLRKTRSSVIIDEDQTYRVIRLPLSLREHAMLVPSLTTGALPGIN
jgi:hypothetical protein